MGQEPEDYSRDRQFLDRQLLAAIKRGPGQYPTPAPDRVNRLIAQGLVKKERGNLRLTLKGWLVAWFYR